MRLFVFTPLFLIPKISIHAPLTGCDLLEGSYCLIFLYFNPRTPYGMRLSWDGESPREYIFQSTHPLRDATVSQRASFLLVPHFNPRTPYGMRRFSYRRLPLMGTFQSTHPLRDATVDEMILLTAYTIFQSTHPLRDATVSLSSPVTHFCDFNPRTPYGMRRYCRCVYRCIYRFQSTHPLRDATQKC